MWCIDREKTLPKPPRGTEKMYSLKDQTATELQPEGECENLSAAELKKEANRWQGHDCVTYVGHTISNRPAEDRRHQTLQKTDATEH